MTDPEAFPDTVEHARSFPDERWRERPRPSEQNVTFVPEAADAFDAMVSAFMDERPDETLHLVGMWAAPDVRSSGLARKLVERVIEWSRVREAACVLLSVEGGNARAARLYERCGFVELDTPPSLPCEPPPGTRFYAAGSAPKEQPCWVLHQEQGCAGVRQ